MFSFFNPFAAIRRRREEKLRKKSLLQKVPSASAFEFGEGIEEIADAAEEVATAVFDAVVETESSDNAHIFDGVFKNEKTEKSFHKTEAPVEKDIPLEVKDTPIETYHHIDDSDSIKRNYVPIDPSYTSPESYDSPSYGSDSSSDSGSCDSGGGGGD